MYGGERRDITVGVQAAIWKTHWRLYHGLGLHFSVVKGLVKIDEKHQILICCAILSGKHDTDLKHTASKFQAC